MAICTNCGTTNKDGIKFCKGCGTKLEQVEPLACVTCSAPLVPNSKFCKKCGTPVESSPAAPITSAIPATSSAMPAAPITEPAQDIPKQPKELANETAPASAEPVCGTCSAPMLPGAKFCKKCGAKTEISPAIDVEVEPAPPVQPDTKPAGAAPTPIAQTSAAPEFAAPKPVKPVTEPSPKFEPKVAPPPAPAKPAAPELYETTDKPKKPPILIIVAAFSVVALASVGAYYYLSDSTKAEQPVMPTVATPVAPANPLPATPTPATTPPPVAAATATPPATPPPTPIAATPTASVPAITPVAPQNSAPVTSPTKTTPASDTPKKSAPAPVEVPKPPQVAKVVKPASTVDPLHDKVTVLLGKADSYITNLQYDKAIATAESVLELDPGNTAAQALIKKAKAKQLDALKSGTEIN